MKKFVIVLLIVALAAGAWFWFRKSAPAAADEETKPTAQVEVAPLQIQTISELLPAYGVVETTPSGARAVTLSYDSIVKSVAVGPGSRVAKGDLIMEVTPTPDAQMTLDSARSAASLADKTLEATRQRFDLRLATSQDVLTAQQAADDAKIKLSSFEKRGEGGGGRIVAPSAGIVTKLDLQPGTTVPAGTALLILSSTAHLEAHLSMEAGDAAKVQKGQLVQLTSINRPALDQVQGTVRLVGASVDAAAGSVDVRVTMPEEAPWFPGEHLQAAIEVQKKSGLVIARSAVLPEDDKQVLFTVKDGKAVKHEVEVEITAGDLVEVVSKDLHAGDTVVIVGNYELEDGMAVEVPSKEGADEKKADESKDSAKDAQDKSADAKPAAADKPAADKSAAAPAANPDGKKSEEKPSGEAKPKTEAKS